jgi:SNF2 family DNA or RNA helicase
VQREEVRTFGPYIYWEKRGFSTFSIDPRIPPEFLSKKRVSKKDWYKFFTELYPYLVPYVVDCSKELTPVKSPTLSLLGFSKIVGGLIRGELELKEKGEKVDPFSLKGEKERFLLTPIGLIDQKNFSWLDEIEKEMPPWRWLKLFLLLSPNIDRLPEKDKKVLHKLISLKAGKVPELKGFTANLRPYQKVGLQWLYHLFERGFSGLLADDMGLGKTLQAIAMIAALLNKRKGPRCLIICPTSVLYHWKEKIETFFPSASFILFHGVKREFDKIRKRQVPIMITSYGVAKRDIFKLKKIPFDLIFFDEIQMAKNHMSRLWEALTQLKGGMLVGLSGTPVENRLRELKALFDLLLPGYFPSETRFRDEFIIPIEREERLEKKKLLQRLTSPFILRRTKSEVLQELPEKIEEIAHCEMTHSQRELYKQVLEEGKKPFIKALEAGKSISFVHVFALLQKLKEVTNHPSLYNKSPEIQLETSSGKWNLYQELLEEALASGQKVVVFSQSLLMLDYLGQDLDKKGIGWSSIRGSTQDRAGAINKFKEESCKVFLASLKAGGVGIDLTSASVVIHYDRWWNPAKEDQATDRVHRFGQTRGVQVFKLMTLDTIEERINEILKQKGRLKAGLFKEMGEDELPNLTKEDILFLLEGPKKIADAETSD